MHYLIAQYFTSAHCNFAVSWEGERNSDITLLNNFKSGVFTVTVNKSFRPLKKMGTRVVNAISTFVPKNTDRLQLLSRSSMRSARNNKHGH